MRNEVSLGVESREVVRFILNPLGKAHLLLLAQHIQQQLLNLKHSNSSSLPPNPGVLTEIVGDSFGSISCQTHHFSELPKKPLSATQSTG